MAAGFCKWCPEVRVFNTKFHVPPGMEYNHRPIGEGAY